MDRLERRQSSSALSLAPHLMPSHRLILYPREPVLQMEDLSSLDLSSLTPSINMFTCRCVRFCFLFQLPQLEELTWAWDHQTLNAFVISFCVAHPDQVWRLKYSSFRQSLPFCLSIHLICSDNWLNYSSSFYKDLMNDFSKA